MIGDDDNDDNDDDDDADNVDNGDRGKTELIGKHALFFIKYWNRDNHNDDDTDVEF